MQTSVEKSQLRPSNDGILKSQISEYNLATFYSFWSDFIQRN